MTTPSIAEVIQRARREKWTRLALLGRWHPDEGDGWWVSHLLDRGWTKESLVVVREVDAEPADLIASLAQVRSLKELALEYPKVEDAGAQAIAKHLTDLTSLDLSGNDIGDAGVSAVVHRLRHLRRLALNENEVSALPNEIGQLSSLDSLSLAKNDLKALPPTLLQLRRLRFLDVDGNPHLNLPPEFVDHERDAARILAWYFGQKRRLNEAKVLMVGQGGVGKTSLVGAVIHNHKADPHKPKTEKIRIDT